MDLPVTDRRTTVTVVLALLAFALAQPSRAADKPVDNVPDGVHTSPPNSRMVTRPSPECPDKAMFRVDSTDYTEWANNVPVSKWTNTTETFLRCVGADGSTSEGATPDGAPPDGAPPN